MTKEEEVMEFLDNKIFNSILSSSDATNTLKQGVRYTIMRMNKLDAEGMVRYYWSAIVGTERSIDFARQMHNEGFTRFEDVEDEFNKKFDSKWLES